MEKKPKLLDRKKILISGKSDLNMKILDQSLKTMNDYESATEHNMLHFLAKIFTYEPKLVILIHDNMYDNIEYAKHIRQNPDFEDLPVICISNPLKKENANIKKKIISLNLNYFIVPVVTSELTKFIRQFLDN